MFQRFRMFLIETQAEFRRVQYPTREATLKSTYVVLVVSTIIAVVLGLSDVVLGEFMQQVIYK